MTRNIDNKEGVSNIVSSIVQKTWQAALGQLELSVSSANFRTWIKTLSLYDITPPTATLYTPNIMSKDYVEKKFSDDIFDALHSTNPQITKIVFVVKKPAKATQSVDDIFTSEEKTPQSNISSQTSQSTQLSQKKESGFNTKPSKPSEMSKISSQSSIQPVKQTGIQAHYTFDSFIVGSSNRLAFSAAQLVVEKPGTGYNPLFLYGPAGVGKTHLMWAIYNAIQKTNPDSSSLYITSEEFINEYVNAIRKGNNFTNKYREVDVLFVDDMQFIAGKEKTQEEFFHTFNTLHQNSKQIVLCSDRPPKDIPTLEERLRSRFEWGMVADIAPPDLETRIAILLNKAANQQIALTQEVAEYIASTVENNIRELEGALTKVIGHCRAHQTELSLEVVQQVLGGSIVKKPSLNAQSILEKTAKYYEITLADIVGSKRDRDIVVPRQIAMFLMREDLGLSYPKIASNIGGKDHTTIMHGTKKIETLYKTDKDFADEVAQLREYITK
ncbi:chromosomal replication initiator protein DnaA [Candidatus Saccharibacteria bacterium]|nr:chromosomal replication initiator protein DnaA [Candidatus Saccharibacteria bacterium]